MTRTFRTLLTAVSIVVAIASPGQAQPAFRPPAIPLVTHDPYFSIWSTSDRLTDRPTSHWTGTPHPMSALVRVDGHAFRVMGHLPADVPALTQHSVTVLPLRTVYVFGGDGIELTLTFLSPMLPHDLELVSRPASYVTFLARATDGRAHDVAIYYDASSRIAVNSPNQPVTWDASRDDALERLASARRPSRSSPRTATTCASTGGPLYVAAPKAAGTTTRIARDIDAERSFVTTGALPAADTTDAPRPVDDRTPVLAVTFALGSVSAAPVSRHVIVAYDDEWSVEFMGERARPWWRRDGADAPAMLRAAEGDYQRLVTASEAYDTALMRDLEQRGGTAYARVAALAFRQTLAAHTLVAHPKTGEPLYFSKENFSNGCMGTVDVTYPSSPFFLFFAPKLLAAQLRPVLEYAASPRWAFPFAPHDLGPLSASQRPGLWRRREDRGEPDAGRGVRQHAADARRPRRPARRRVAHPAVLADHRRSGSRISRARASIPRISCRPTTSPVTSRTTRTCRSRRSWPSRPAATWPRRRGDAAEAARLRTVATGMAAKWDEAAQDGDHYRLAFDRAGTWSQKYNLVWDTLLGYRLFPDQVRRRELVHYKTRQNTYGLPLDNRADYTKGDWIVWTATLAETPADFAALVTPLFAFLDETPDRVPFSDWYSTTSGLKRGFQARSVVGGVFIPMLSNRDRRPAVVLASGTYDVAMRRLAFLAFTAAMVVAAAITTRADQKAFLGRWNLTGTGTDSDAIYWLELKEENGQLSGMFLNRGGSPVKLAAVEVKDDELVFTTAAPEGQPGQTFRAKRKGAGLEGSTTAGEKTLAFTGARPPSWPAANANATHTYGKPVELFDGKSLDTWDVQVASKPSGWSVVDGAMTNEKGANNLVSKQTFKDFKIQAEYRIETGSNSGIYLRGRYELQVLDDFGKPPEPHGHMAIYAWVRAARQRQQAGRRVAGDGGGARGQQGHRDAERPEGPRQRDDPGDHRRRARRQRDPARADHAPGRPREGLVPQGHGDADRQGRHLDAHVRRSAMLSTSRALAVVWLASMAIATPGARQSTRPASLLLDHAYVHETRARGEEGRRGDHGGDLGARGGCEKGAGDRADVRDGQVDHASER